MTENASELRGWLDCYCDRIAGMVDNGRLNRDDLVPLAARKLRAYLDLTAMPAPAVMMWSNLGDFLRNNGYAYDPITGALCTHSTGTAARRD